MTGVFRILFLYAVFTVFLMAPCHSMGQEEDGPLSKRAGTVQPGFPELEKKLEGSTGKERVKTLLELAVAYSDSKARKSLEFTLKGIGEARSGGFDILHVRLVNQASECYTRLTDGDNAFKYGEDALKLAEAAKDEPGIAEAFRNIGWAHAVLGFIDKGLDMAERSITLFEKLNMQSRVADVLYLFAYLYFDKRNLAKAQEFGLKGGRLSEKIGDDEQLGHSYNLLGIILHEMSDTTKAKEYYIKAWKLYEKVGYLDGIGATTLNLGNIYGDEKKYSDALKSYYRSLEVNEAFGSRDGLAIIYNNIGYTHEELKSYQEALNYYSMGNTVYTDIKDRRGIASSLLSMARINRIFKRYNKAGELVKKSLKVAVDWDVKDVVQEIYEELAELSKAQKQFKSALEFHEKFRQLSDSLRAENDAEKISEVQARYESGKQDEQIALLEKDREIKALALAKQRYLRNFLIVVAVLIFIAAFILYARYRLKVSITRRLEREIAERRRVEQEMLRSLKLETVGILAAGIAHDFNRLIGTISGSLSSARQQVEADGSSAKMLTSAEKASTQAADLARRLVTFSDSSWVPPEKIIVKELFHNIHEQYSQFLTPEDHIAIPDDLPMIYGDERQLKQVIISILDNAHEAMKDQRNKIVRINGQVVEIEENNPFALIPGEYVSLTFIDNGKGIDPQIMKNIFDPYFSTKDAVTQKGLGLGLAICYSILKKHNGHIAIQSQPGEGTTVTLWLPTFLPPAESRLDEAKSSVELMADAPVNLMK